MMMHSLWLINELVTKCANNEPLADGCSRGLATARLVPFEKKVINERKKEI